MDRGCAAIGIIGDFDRTRLTVGVVVAMKQEFEAVRAELLPQVMVHTIECSQIVLGELDEANYVIFQSGIGTTNAAAGACDLIAHFQPDCLLNLGTTALIADPSGQLQMGEVLAARQHQQWDLDLGGPITGEWTDQRSFVDVLQTGLLQPDQQLWDALAAVDLPFSSAIQFTGNSFFCTAEQRRLLPVAADPVAVDMESFAVAQVCARKQIPFLSLRGITDTGRASANDDFYANVRLASQHSARLARALVRQLCCTYMSLRTQPAANQACTTENTLG